MDLRAIRYFVSVAECRSFSSAADLLCVAQPAISRQVQSLEQELGTQVFFRTTRGVDLTDAGCLLFEKARAILRQMDELKESVRALEAEPSGKVVVGLPPSSSEVLGPKLIEECRRVLPKVELQIIEGLTLVLLPWLEQGKIDIALATDPKTLPGLVFEDLFEEELVILGRKGQLPGRADLGSLLIDHGWKLVTSSHFRRLIEGCLVRESTLNSGVIIVDSVPAMKQLVRAGDCLAVLPFSSAYFEIARGDFDCAVLPGRPKRRLMIGSKPCSSLSSTVKAVRTTVQALGRKEDVIECLAPAG
jgi:LysR family nitrogen assimilation transcriptional regulator